VRFALGATIAALVLAGCSDEHRSRPSATFSARGVTVELPAGWHAAHANLTPNLSDPREVLAVASYRLRYRPDDCAQVPVSALRDLGARGAFVELEERAKSGPPSSEFPRRPPHFGPALGGPSEATACVPGTRMSEHWFGFTDHGRHFYVRVAYGPAASSATKNDAWKLLDGLKVERAG
jgi:hypothetical protein